MEEILKKIKWLRHAGFRLDGKAVIYIDPWNITAGPPADLVLVTHSHYDHCSPEDIKKIRKESAVVVCPPDCTGKVTGEVKTVKPGDKISVAGVEIEAVPAYNVSKQFHPQSAGGVGYILTLEGVRIYHAGDTDLIPEMDEIKADILLLPVGGTYTMGAREAAEAANKIKPRVVIPMHYGEIVGTPQDAETFRKLCRCEVRILAAE